MVMGTGQRRQINKDDCFISAFALCSAFFVNSAIAQSSPGIVTTGDPLVDSQVNATALDQKRKTGTLLPGVRTALSYSTNSSLEDNGRPNKGGDFILEVTPYIQAESEATRLKYKLDYAVANLYRFKTGDKIVGRQRLQGNVTASVAGDWLWLDANGLIANTYADLFGPLSADPNVAFVNTAQVRTLSLSPYIRSRVLGFADTTLRYGIQVNSSSANTVGQGRLNHSFSADVRGAEVDGQNWNWSWGGEHTIRKFGTENIKRNFSIGSAYWVPTPSVRLTTSAVYDQIDGLRARNGDVRGLGPGLGIDWSPADRTRLNIQAIRRYYGNSINATFSTSSSFFVSNISFNRGVTGSLDSSIFSIDPGSVFGTGSVQSNPLYRSLIAQNLRLGFGIPFGAGLIDDTYILEQRLGGLIGVIGIRNSLTFNLSATRRDTTLFSTLIPAGGSGPRAGNGAGVSGTYNGILELRSLALDYRFKFDSRSNFNLGINHINTESKSLGFNSRSTSLSAGVSTRLTPDAQAGAGIRRTEGKTTGLTSTKFEDTGVFGTLDLKF
jgi:uncharacterized protein (PEP-CTERM system associated)